MTLVREVLRVIVIGKRARAQTAMRALELAAQLTRISQSRYHPMIKAGEVLERLYWINPYPGYSEQLGYLLANFLLMRAGYPPAILFRVIFPTLIRYREEYLARMSDRGDPRFTPPYAKYRAFLCACLVRAVRRSCLLGIRPVCCA